MATSVSTDSSSMNWRFCTLWRTLGVSLFDRSSKGVEPTPYGSVLIKRGVAIFDELRQGIREIETIKDPKRCPLWVISGH